MKNTLRWLVIWNLALGAACGYGFYQLRQEGHRRCEARNDATEQGVIIGAESIIEVATEADPERVEAYRKTLRRKLDEARVDC